MSRIDHSSCLLLLVFLATSVMGAAAFFGSLSTSISLQRCARSMLAPSLRNRRALETSCRGHRRMFAAQRSNGDLHFIPIASQNATLRSTMDSETETLLAYRYKRPKALLGLEALTETRRTRKEETVVVILNGFGSTMDGSNKVATIVDHIHSKWNTDQTTRYVSTLTMDYRGHGRSTFRRRRRDDTASQSPTSTEAESSTAQLHDFVLSDWMHDVEQVFHKVILHNSEDEDKDIRTSVIIVASSMGALIALNVIRMSLGNVSNDKMIIAGLVGIAAAPRFLQHVYDTQLSHEQKHQQLPQQGYIQFSSQYKMTPESSNNNNNSNNMNVTTAQSTESTTPLPPTNPDPYSVILTQRLFDDAKQWNLPLNSKTPFPFPIHLFHGMQDPDVPHDMALQLAKCLDPNPTVATFPATRPAHKVHLTLFPNGDHRLSKPQELPPILEVVDDLIARALLEQQ